MITVTSEIDETRYGLLCDKEAVKPLFEALNKLYGKIWIESCYDPASEQTRELCLKLLDDIRSVNEILHFKK